MAYRDDAGDVVEAPTAEGPLRVEFGPRWIKATVASRTLHVVDKIATVLEHRRKVKRESFKIDTRLAVARDVPHEDLGVWVELEAAGMRRIFGVEPVSLLEPEGLDALATLDRLATRMRNELADHAGDIFRAIEIGRGNNKVLLADHGDRFAVYARRLFRDRARLAMTIHADGRIVIPDRLRRADGPNGKKPLEIVVRSRFGITVLGDYVRFGTREGQDLARVAIPWITPEDRHELARRIGQLVDTEPAPAAIAHPWDASSA